MRVVRHLRPLLTAQRQSAERTTASPYRIFLPIFRFDLKYLHQCCCIDLTALVSQPWQQSWTIADRSC